MTDDQANPKQSSTEADLPAFVDRRRRGQRDWFKPIDQADLPRPLIPAKAVKERVCPMESMGRHG